MFPEELEFSEKSIMELKAEACESHFRTRMNFLRNQNGLRKNKMHLFMAPTSAGKSTLVRSILVDIVFQNKDKKILLWLSEETKKEFKREFSAAVPSHEVLKNIRIVSDLDTTYTDEEIKSTIEQSIDHYGIDCLIVDNITTSRLYNDKPISEQSKMAYWYKKLCSKTTLILIAHTNSNDHATKLLDETNIRGSKTITNLTEFLYILQPVYVGNSLIQFINVKKHRGQNIVNRFFRLIYNAEMKTFSEDMIVDFEAIKDYFKKRNRLDGK